MAYIVFQRCKSILCFTPSANNKLDLTSMADCNYVTLLPVTSHPVHTAVYDMSLSSCLTWTGYVVFKWCQNNLDYLYE